MPPFVRALAAGTCLTLAVVSAWAAPACGPPPTSPYPLVAALPTCRNFPDPWLRSNNTRVATAAEWRDHRLSTIELLEHYMYGHAPEQPPVRSTLTGTTTVTEYCERVNSRCTSPTRCKLRCVPLSRPQTLRNYTLRVGPSPDKVVL